MRVAFTITQLYDSAQWGAERCVTLSELLLLERLSSCILANLHILYLGSKIEEWQQSSWHAKIIECALSQLASIPTLPFALTLCFWLQLFLCFYSCKPSKRTTAIQLYWQSESNVCVSSRTALFVVQSTDIIFLAGEHPSQSTKDVLTDVFVFMLAAKYLHLWTVVLNLLHIFEIASLLTHWSPPWGIDGDLCG